MQQNSLNGRIWGPVRGGGLTDRSDDVPYFVLEGFGTIKTDALSEEIPVEVACIAGVKWLYAS